MSVDALGFDSDEEGEDSEEVPVVDPTYHDILEDIHDLERSLKLLEKFHPGLFRSYCKKLYKSFFVLCNLAFFLCFE